MKNFFLIFLLHVFVFNAQEKGDIEIGLSAGLNASNVTQFKNDPVTPKLGFNATLSAEYYFSESWGLKNKLIYDQKGWLDAVIDNENISKEITDFRQNYVTVSVLISYHFGSNENFYAHFGPYVGVLLGAEEEDTSLDLTYVFNPIDLGLSYAIGYRLYITESVRLFTEVEVATGLVDVFAIDNLNADYTVVNGRTHLNFGILFNL
jgi:hypothetical protein